MTRKKIKTKKREEENKRGTPKDKIVIDNACQMVLIFKKWSPSHLLSSLAAKDRKKTTLYY